MVSSARERFHSCRSPWPKVSDSFVAAIALLLIFASAQSVHCQTFSLIHVFTNGSDGSAPNSITIDRAGNLYGTSASGVFRVKPANGGWIFTPLCDLSGFEPVSVTIAPNGLLYGTTITGGLNGSGCGTYGCGVVFRLQPPARATGSVLGSWNETILYEFTGIPDGATGSGGVVLDEAGNLYGTTAEGGELGRGTVYKLAPAAGSWTETILYAFTSLQDGMSPWAGGGFRLTRQSLRHDHNRHLELLLGHYL